MQNTWIRELLLDIVEGSSDSFRKSIQSVFVRSWPTPQRIGVVLWSCCASVESLKVRRGEHLEELSRVWVHDHLPWEHEHVRLWWGLNRCPLYSIKEQGWYHLDNTDPLRGLTAPGSRQTTIWRLLLKESGIPSIDKICSYFQMFFYSMYLKCNRNIISHTHVWNRVGYEYLKGKWKVGSFQDWS